MFRWVFPNKDKEIEETADMIQQLVSKITDKAFDRLEGQISKRKLFVMFEQQLECDPSTDHIHPKNVLPLFKPYLDEQRIAAKQLDEGLTKEILRTKFLDILKEEIQKRADAEQTSHMLGGKVEELKRLLEISEQNHRAYVIEVGKLKRSLEQNINQLTEQLVQFLKIGSMYKADIARQRQEMESSITVFEQSQVQQGGSQDMKDLQSFQLKLRQMAQQNSIAIQKLKELDGYKEKYDKLILDFQKLKKDFEQEQINSAQIKNQLSETQDQLVTAQNTVASQTDTIAYQKGKITELEKMSTSSREQKKRQGTIEQQLKDAQKEISELQKQLAQREKDIITSNNQIKKLQTEIKEKPQPRPAMPPPKEPGVDKSTQCESKKTGDQSNKQTQTDSSDNINDTNMLSSNNNLLQGLRGQKGSQRGSLDNKSRISDASTYSKQDKTPRQDVVDVNKGTVTQKGGTSKEQTSSVNLSNMQQSGIGNLNSSVYDNLTEEQKQEIRNMQNEIDELRRQLGLSPKYDNNRDNSSQNASGNNGQISNSANNQNEIQRQKTKTTLDQAELSRRATQRTEELRSYSTMNPDDIPDDAEFSENLSDIDDPDQLKQIAYKYKQRIQELHKENKRLHKEIAELKNKLATYISPDDLLTHPLVQKIVHDAIKAANKNDAAINDLMDQLNQVQNAKQAVEDLQNNLDATASVKAPKQQIVKNIANNIENFTNDVDDAIIYAQRTSGNVERVLNTIKGSTKLSEEEKSKLQSTLLEQAKKKAEKQRKKNEENGETKEKIIQKNGEDQEEHLINTNTRNDLYYNDQESDDLNDPVIKTSKIDLTKDYKSSFVEKQLQKFATDGHQDLTQISADDLSKAMHNSLMEQYVEANRAKQNDDLMIISKTQLQLDQLEKRLKFKIEELKRRNKINVDELYVRYLASMRFLSKDAQQAAIQRDKNFIKTKQEQQINDDISRLIKTQVEASQLKPVNLQIVNIEPESTAEFGFKLTSVDNQLIFTQNDDAYENDNGNIIELGQSQSMRYKTLEDVQQVAAKIGGVNLSPTSKLPAILINPMRQISPVSKSAMSVKRPQQQQDHMTLMSYLDDLTKNQESRGRELIRIKGDLKAK